MVSVTIAIFPAWQANNVDGMKGKKKITCNETRRVTNMSHSITRDVCLPRMLARCPKTQCHALVARATTTLRLYSEKKSQHNQPIIDFLIKCNVLPLTPFCLLQYLQVRKTRKPDRIVIATRSHRTSMPSSRFQSLINQYGLERISLKYLQVTTRSSSAYSFPQGPRSRTWYQNENQRILVCV